MRFVGGLEVSEIGGRRCRLQNVVGIARRNFRARISKPARRIVRVNGDQPGESVKHALRIALGEGCSSSLAQRVWGLIRQIIAVLRHLRREPNAIVGEIGVAIIGLQGFGAAGDSENQHETQEPSDRAHIRSVRSKKAPIFPPQGAPELPHRQRMAK